MANPTPKAADKDAQRAPEPKAAEKGDDESIAATRFLVLKAITLADGRTVMPGEEFVPDETFPARRPKQLVEQKYLRPID